MAAVTPGIAESLSHFRIGRIRKFFWRGDGICESGRRQLDRAALLVPAKAGHCRSLARLSRTLRTGAWSRLKPDTTYEAHLAGVT